MTGCLELRRFANDRVGLVKGVAQRRDGLNTAIACSREQQGVFYKLQEVQVCMQRDQLSQ